jgi:hypothetical protein
MPLPLPNLDTRRWTDLVDEGRALVPRYAPEWTDHNVHDPGITLIELLAYMVEGLVYRVNRIPRRHRWKFMALVGLFPRPPRPAEAVLQARLRPGAPMLALPAGLLLETGDESGARVFEVTDPVSLFDITLGAVQVFDGTGFTDRTRPAAALLGFPIFGPDPATDPARPDAAPAIYLGFDRPFPAGGALSLHFHLDGGAPGERERIRAEAEAWAAGCAPTPPETCVPCASRTDPDCPEGPAPRAGGRRPPEGGIPPHHSARVSWEYYSLDGWRALRADQGEIEDATRSLTLDGTVGLRVPPGSAPLAIGAAGAPLYYVRCRFRAGAFDSAPRLLGLIVNPIQVRQQAPAWSTLALASGASVTAPQAGAAQPLTLAFGPGPRPELTRVAPGPAGGAPSRRVVEFVPAGGGSPGSLTLDAEVGLLGSGLPDQEIRLGGRQVADGKVEVWSVEGTGWRRWEQRPDLDASRPESPHYTLDPTDGVIRFGDGVRGRVPPDGSAVLASYRATEAAAGAVPEGRAWTIARQAWNASLLPGPGATPASVEAALAELRNPFAAGAGEDRESLEALEARAVAQLRAHETLVELVRTAEPATSAEATLDQLDPAEVRRCAPPRRATTLLDYERLALDVPGTRVRRARAWANLDPGYPGLEAAGTVSVIVVPSLPRGRPRPSAGLLRAVRRYLDRRRVLCTRLVVAGPEYLTVTVRAQVRAFRNADPERVRTAVVEALHALFDPLDGGPRRRGWPFGRDVYRSEVLAQIDAVAGVDHVTSCTLTADGREVVCGNVCLPPTWLVASGDHAIEVMRP